jgi:hypothetical protein
MALDEDLAERIRGVLAGTGAVREVRMFGGLCFMSTRLPERRSAASSSASAKTNTPVHWSGPTPELRHRAFVDRPLSCPPFQVAGA